MNTFRKKPYIPSQEELGLHTPLTLRRRRALEQIEAKDNRLIALAVAGTALLGALGASIGITHEKDHFSGTTKTGITLGAFAANSPDERQRILLEMCAEANGGQPITGLPGMPDCDTIALHRPSVHDNPR